MKISGRDIQAGTIGREQIARGAVSNEHLVRGSVGSGAIAARSVDESHLSRDLGARLLPFRSDSVRDWRAALENAPSPPSGSNPFVTLKDVQLQTNHWGEPTAGPPRATGAEPRGTVRLDSSSGVVYYVTGGQYRPISFSHAKATDLESDPLHRHLTESDLSLVRGLSGVRESGTFQKLSPLRAEPWRSISGAVKTSREGSPVFALDGESVPLSASRDEEVGAVSPLALTRRLLAAEVAIEDDDDDGVFDAPFRERILPRCLPSSQAPIRGSTGTVDTGAETVSRADKLFLGEGLEKSSGYVSISAASFIPKSSLDVDRIGSGGFREGNLMARGAFVSSTSSHEDRPQVIDLAFPDRLAEDWVSLVTDVPLSPVGFQKPVKTASLTAARVSRLGVELAPVDRWEEENTVPVEVSEASYAELFSDGPERSWIVSLSLGAVSLTFVPSLGTARGVALKTRAGGSSSGTRLESVQWASLDAALVHSVPAAEEEIELRFVFFGTASDGSVLFYASAPIDPVAPFVGSELEVYDCSLQMRLAFEQLAGRDMTDVSECVVKLCGKQRRNVSGGPAHVGFAFTSRSRLYAGSFDWSVSGSVLEPYFAMVQVAESVDRFAAEGLDDNGMVLAVELLPRRALSVCVVEFGGVRSALVVQGPTWEGTAIKPRREVSGFWLASDQPRRAQSDAAAVSVLDGGRFVHLLVLTQDGILRDVVWAVSTSGGSPSSPPGFVLVRDSDVFSGVTSVDAVVDGPCCHIVATSADGSQFYARTDWATRQDPVVFPLKTSGSFLRPLSGTVSVVADDSAVSGSSTAFLTEVQPGDEVRIGSVFCAVARVESDTALTLSAPYSGSSGSPLTAYKVDRSVSSWDSERPWAVGERCFGLSSRGLEFLTDATTSPPYPAPKPVGNGTGEVRALVAVSRGSESDDPSGVFRLKPVGGTAFSAQFLTNDGPEDLDDVAWYGVAGSAVRKHGTDEPMMLLVGGSSLDHPTFTARDHVNWLVLDAASGAETVEEAPLYRAESSVGGLPVAVSHASLTVAGCEQDAFIAFVSGGLLRGRPYGDPESAHFVQRLLFRQSLSSPPEGADVSFHLDRAESKFVYPVIQGGYGVVSFLHYVKGAWKLCLVSGNGDLFESEVDLSVLPGPNGTVVPADESSFEDVFSPVKVAVESTRDGIAIPSSVLGGIAVAQWNNASDRGIVSDPRAFGGPEDQPSKTWVVYLENESDLSRVAVKVLRVDENQEPRRRWFSANVHLQDESYRPAARLEAQIKCVGWKEAPDDEAVSKAAVFIVHGGSVYCQGEPSRDRCPGKETWFLEVWEAQLAGDLEVRCRWARVDSGFGLSDAGPVMGAASASLPRRFDVGAAASPLSYLCWGGSSHTVYVKGHPAHAWAWRWPKEAARAQVDMRSAFAELSGPYVTGISSLVVLGPIDCAEWEDLRVKASGEFPSGTAVSWALSTNPISDVWFRYDNDSSLWVTTTQEGASGLFLQHVHALEGCLVNAWTSSSSRRDLGGASQLWIAVALSTTNPHLTPLVRSFDFEFRAANGNVFKQVSSSQVNVWQTASGRSTLVEEPGTNEVFVRASYDVSSTR